MPKVGHVPAVGNASGQTVHRHKRSKERCAHISPDELRLLRDSGQSKNDHAIFRARLEVAGRYPGIYGSADDVTAAVLNNTISPEHLELLIELRRCYLSEPK